MVKKIIKPPFSKISAKEKVQVAEDLWNTRDPALVVKAYTEDCEWRNRNEFLAGHQQIQDFLVRKWNKELDYLLKKTLFNFSETKIAVQFEYEWRDDSGQWYRSYGLEHWEFADDGRMKKRTASINDLRIQDEERVFKEKRRVR